MTAHEKTRIAFLTMEDAGGWSIDADLSFAPLRALGWQPEWIPWRTSGVEWSDFAAVYLAATWDYPQDPERFLELVACIAASNAIVVNEPAIVRWNIAKTYLRDIEAGGAPVVPSIWDEQFHERKLQRWFAAHRAQRLIIKPVISTNATNTFLVSQPVAPATLAALRTTFGNRPFVVQPFVDSVRTEGEFSLIYLGGAFCHAIQKVPKAGDFRVQEEHGAEILSVQPEGSLREAGDRVISLLHPMPVYARCDFVRASGGSFLLMELELIEPSLYLRAHEKAPLRFAQVLDRHIRKRSALNGGEQ